MKGYTIDEVLSWDVCYTREQLEGLYAGRETLTARDIFDLPIPDEDKLYALLRPKVIPKRELHLLACDFAERVAHLTRDPRSAEATRVKRLWLDGKATDEELATARAAAKAAAWEAADAAWEAWKSAWAAADAAAEAPDAAWAAANAAAEASAAAEAVAAEASVAKAAAEARTAERKAQLALVREVVERLDREEEQE